MARERHLSYMTGDIRVMEPHESETKTVPGSRAFATFVDQFGRKLKFHVHQERARREDKGK